MANNSPKLGGQWSTSVNTPTQAIACPHWHCMSLVVGVKYEQIEACVCKFLFSYCISEPARALFG